MDGSYAEARISRFLWVLELLHPFVHGLAIHRLRALFRLGRFVVGGRNLTVRGGRKKHNGRHP